MTRWSRGVAAVAGQEDVLVDMMQSPRRRVYYRSILKHMIEGAVTTPLT